MHLTRENKKWDLKFLTIAASSAIPPRLQSTISSDEQTSNRQNQTSSLETDISALASLIASTKKPTTTTTNGNGTGNPKTVDREEIEELEAKDVVRVHVQQVP